VNKRNLVIAIILLLLLGIWSPWDRWDFSLLGLLGFKSDADVSSLQVVNMAGRVQVYVDDETQDGWVVDAEEDEPLFIPAIASGDHQVKLVRLTETEGALYAELNKLIYFAPGLAVTISYELGPSSEFSGGHIIYAKSSLDGTGNTYLSVRSDQDDLGISLDGGDDEDTPLTRKLLDISMQHNLKITKEGYETQEFTILPADDIERQKLIGFELVVDADLFLRPIPVY